jgi:hypothetical protein
MPTLQGIAELVHQINQPLMVVVEDADSKAQRSMSKVASPVSLPKLIVLDLRP